MALQALANSRERGEADRARAVLPTLAGWTSLRIAEAFGARQDTVRLWRSDFARGVVAALKVMVRRRFAHDQSALAPGAGRQRGSG